jgi:hypothetical protein
VNQEYIRSASQEDAYRTEPPFKLQGSYRNMNKLAEKVVAAMNDAEIEQLIDDHYASESQTLTTGAEQNLLKLAELRGRMSDEQKGRWRDIKDAFVRTGRGGKKGDDPVARVTGALSGVDEQLQRIREAITHATIAATSAASSKRSDAEALAPILERMQQALTPLGKPPRVELRIDDGSAAAAVAVVNVVREQTAAFQSVITSLNELAKRLPMSPFAHAASPGTGTLPPPHPPERLTNPGFPAPPSLPRNARATTPPPPGSMVDVRLEELAFAVNRLEQRLSTLPTSLPRFEVALDASSPSMFWRGMDGEDVVRHGGVFVATYAKLPPLGAILALGLEFPGGVRADCQAQVSWVQEHLSDESPAGFGAKLVSPSSDLCAMIAQFVRYREPLVRE